MKKVAKYNIGDLVIHNRHGYRAVVVDVDPIFQASGRYNPQADKRLFTQRNPWYRLLVDGTSQMTYVEECFLTPDLSKKSVENPYIEDFLIKRHGVYQSIYRGH